MGRSMTQSGDSFLLTAELVIEEVSNFTQWL